jgi:hypothetical protein
LLPEQGVVALLSGWPAATGKHRPRLKGSSHRWQVPWQAFSQQWPSVQKPLWHSVAEEQVAARFFCGMQVPFGQ